MGGVFSGYQAINGKTSICLSVYLSMYLNYTVIRQWVAILINKLIITSIPPWSEAAFSFVSYVTLSIGMGVAAQLIDEDTQ